MKKKVLMAASVCIVLLCVIIFAAVAGKKPYKNLNASEIVSATVRLTPPDKTVLVADIEELTEYLRDVVIYNEDNSYKGSVGQGVIYTLTMSDGTQTEIMAYAPFLIIDGIGYKTKYKPCNALNAYANRLLNEEDTITILKEPPWLAVISDNTSCSALLGSYSWQYLNDDGTSTGMEADSVHPLECKDLLVLLETTDTTATLRFQEEPDAILNVRCWSDEHWSFWGFEDSYAYPDEYYILSELEGSPVTEIGDWALGDGEKLRHLHVPPSVTFIGEGKFYFTNMVFYGEKGSFIEEFCKENGFQFVAE